MGNERLRRYRWRKKQARKAVLARRGGYISVQSQFRVPRVQDGLRKDLQVPPIYGGLLSVAVADAVSRWFKKQGRT